VKASEWAIHARDPQAGLAAYGLLVEEQFGLPARRGFIYLMKARGFAEVVLDPPFRNSVLTTLSAVQHIRDSEYLPPPVDEKNKCLGCEFRRLCGDVAL